MLTRVYMIMDKEIVEPITSVTGLKLKEIMYIQTS